MEDIVLVTSLLLVLLEDVGAEFCTNGYMYCENGCCGSSCCVDNIPVIVGSTVGGLAFIVIVISSICVYLKKSNKADRTIGVDPNMMPTAALAAQQAGYAPQMVQPLGYGAYPPPALYYGMQTPPNPLLAYPLSANLPPPYLASAPHPPPNPVPANLAAAAVYHPPPNPTPANSAPNHPPPNTPTANSPPNHPPLNLPPDNPASLNSPPQQAPSPN